MISEKWSSWVIQTASRWEDIEKLVEYSGVGPIDNEHLRLVEYIVEVNQIVGGQVSRIHHYKMQLETLESFAEFAKRHFTHEETLISVYGLPQLQQQQEEHGRILSLFDKMVSDFRSGKLHIAQEERLNLELALVNHINSTDVESFELLGLLRSFDEMDSWPELPYFLNECGVEKLDREHTEVLQKMATLAQKTSGLSEIKRLELIDEIVADVISHFADEEHFLREHKLLGQDENRKASQPVLDALKLYKKALEKSPKGVDESHEYVILMAWMRHVNVDDSRFFAYRPLIQKLEKSQKSVDEALWMIRSTGYMALDKEHQEFVKIVASITDSLSEDERDEKFATLLLHVTSHFAHEEEILNKMGHPELFRHSVEHQHLLERIVGYFRLFESGAVGVSDRFRFRLVDWWLSHTNGMDYQTFVLHKKLMEVNA